MARPQGHTARLPTLQLIHELARQYNIEPQLVQAIVTVESNFNPYAISRAGAQGLMQLMPETAARYQVTNPFDPRANIEGGIRYLKDLLHLFPGDLRRALAAYNAGEQVVQRYGGIPPYPETQQYVERVLALYGVHVWERKIYRYRTGSGSILFTDTPR
jgi:soluble lytic murein transglycosylase-like protein